ncbi:MAG: DUF2147 domain-containing protein [Bacteroidota bacterium]
MKKLFSTTLFILALAAFSFLQAQSSPVGTWKTIDDETGEAKSHVEIYKKGDKFYGKVVNILTDRKDALCSECKGAKKNKPILGMVIIEDVASYKDYWKGGTILDPNKGSEYGVSIWYEDGKKDELKVRGKHWTGLYRDQTWYRVK